VRAVVRNADKAKELAALGAEIFVADMTDQAALGKAFAGAEGVYLMSPPDMGAKDFINERKALTQKQVDTAKAAKVPFVVLLSSIGSQESAGTGPILTTYHFEQQLRASSIPSTFVRAGYFVENWGAVLHPLKADGVLPTFIPQDLKIPMVATVDIGKQIAQALLDGPRGVRVVELAGPVDASPKDAAEIFSKILGKPVNIVEPPLEAVVPTFTSFGISQNNAELFQEMYAGLRSGKVAFTGAELVRGTTPLETTLRQLAG